MSSDALSAHPNEDYSRYRLSIVRIAWNEEIEYYTTYDSEGNSFGSWNFAGNGYYPNYSPGTEG